jgi:hypothetical protein
VSLPDNMLTHVMLDLGVLRVTVTKNQMGRYLRSVGTIPRLPCYQYATATFESKEELCKGWESELQHRKQSGTRRPNLYSLWDSRILRRLQLGRQRRRESFLPVIE